MQNKSFIRSIFRNGPSDLQFRKPAVLLSVRQWCEQNSLSFHTYNYWKHLLKEEVVDQSLPDIVPLSLPVLSGSDSSSGTTAPAFPSIRANRSIRSNNSNVKMLINGVSIEIDTAVSEEFLGKLIKTLCHA